jgi:DNA-binding CsgD family transcriptional regulator
MYDSKAIARIAAEIGEKIDSAALGQIGWEEIPRAIVDAFPGSMASLQSMSVDHASLNFVYTSNLDPHFLRSYTDHYAFINPWSRHWNRMPGGTVALSEAVYPVRLIARTEFYNDWLRPQKQLDAAAGLKISDDGENLIFLPVHYDPSCADRYDSALLELLGKLRGNLGRAMRVSRYLAASVESAAASSAIVERQDCAAFVVDSALCLRGANGRAEDLFARNGPLRARHGRITLSRSAEASRFAEVVRSLADGAPADVTPLAMRSGPDTYLLSFAVIPPASGGIAGLLLPRRLVLVLARRLSASQPFVPSPGLLADIFRLTPAEIRLCNELAVGASVGEAAANLGISVETARVRCKAVMQKTETHRQLELVTLLRSLR